MADNKGRGWHGDSQGHAEASRERDDKKTNWLPLLLLPVAFFLGWAGHDAASNDTSEIASESQMQPGVGGGPYDTITPTVTQTNPDF